jgi:hypothetical protein
MARKVFGYICQALIILSFVGLALFLFLDGERMDEMTVILSYCLCFGSMIFFGFLSSFLLKGTKRRPVRRENNFNDVNSSSSSKAGSSSADHSEAYKSSGSSGNEDEDPKLMKRCPQCGSMNDIDAHFCKHCGKDISDKR